MDTEDRGPKLFPPEPPRICPLCRQPVIWPQTCVLSRNGAYAFHRQCMDAWADAAAHGTLSDEMWKRMPTAKEQGYTRMILADGTIEEYPDEARVCLS